MVAQLQNPHLHSTHKHGTITTMMNDERSDLPEIEAQPDQPQPEAESPPVLAADIDVEQALAAVASLHQLTGQDDDQPEQALASSDVDELEIAEFRRIPAETDEPEAQESPQPAPSDFQRPSASMLVRGQAASVVPALLLIVSGAALTLLLTTTDFVLHPQEIAAGALGLLGASLVAYWWSSGRWASGAFFAGVSLLLLGGTALWLFLTDFPGWMQGYPLLLTALGVALILTDLFSPAALRVWAGGLILAVAGLAAALVTTGALQPALLQIASSLLPVALVIVAILFIAPLIQRRR